MASSWIGVPQDAWLQDGQAGPDGTPTAVKEEPAGTFQVVQTLPTANGARTITTDPKTHRFYPPCTVQTGSQNEFSVLVVGAAQP